LLEIGLSQDADPVGETLLNIQKALKLDTYRAAEFRFTPRN
jgi:hypothetical protein